MNSTKINILLLFSCFLFAACSGDDNHDIDQNFEEETAGLELIQSIQNEAYTINLYNETGAQFQVGYNKIYVRAEDENGKPVKDIDLSWKPVMTMQMGEMTHRHSSPFSELTKVQGTSTLFEGYIVFSMPGDGSSSWWELTVTYRIAGQEFSATEKVKVVSTENKYKKVFTSVVGKDGLSYLLALVEPAAPEIGVNDAVIALFKSDENGSFPIENHYTIKIDPRMPSMGNHSAPGNEDLIQREDGFYHGKTGFSMTGNWTLNLILQNENGEVVSGEPVTEENQESSLHFKVTF